MNPRLSVVIPVFKVENYLERCVRSVLDQDYRDMEVILVDDGSPDRCPQICDDLALQDTRVIVVHKKNGGLSSARNAGIERATGDYIAFLDSDDQWVQGLLSLVMNQLVESDARMLMFAANSLYDDGSIYQRVDSLRNDGQFRVFTTSEFYEHLIASGDFHESACTKILKREFLLSNNLLFKQGIIGEDTEWMFRVMRKVDKIAYSPVPLFLCTEGRMGSITNTPSKKSVWDGLYTIKGSLDYYNGIPESNLKKWELAQCSYIWSICLGLYSGLPKNERVGLKSELRTLKKQLKLSSHPKSRKVGILYSVTGFAFTSFMLSKYIFLHRKNLINKKVKVNSNEK